MGNHRWNMKANLLPELEKFCVGSSRNTQQILENCAVIDSLNPKENKNRCGSLELNSSQTIGSYRLVWLADCTSNHLLHIHVTQQFKSGACPVYQTGRMGAV